MCLWNCTLEDQSPAAKRARRLLAAGLLLVVVVTQCFRLPFFAAHLSSGWRDFGIGLATGLGMTMELCALLMLRKIRRGHSA